MISANFGNSWPSILQGVFTNNNTRKHYETLHAKVNWRPLHRLLWISFLYVYNFAFKVKYYGDRG